MKVRGFDMLEKRLQRVVRKCQYQQERLREQKLRLRSRQLNLARRSYMSSSLIQVDLQQQETQSLPPR